MFERPTIRRHDGSIDIDFHRQARLSQHSSVMTGFSQGLEKIHRGVVAVLLLAAVLYIAPARDGAGSNDGLVGTPHNGVVLKPLATSAQL